MAFKKVLPVIIRFSYVPSPDIILYFLTPQNAPTRISLAPANGIGHSDDFSMNCPVTNL